MAILRSPCFLLAAAIAFLLSGGVANATLVFTDNSVVAGNAVTASAAFSISGTTLTIELTNTSPANALESPGSTLTGVMFLLRGTDPTLTPVSAISPNGIIAAADCNATSCPGTNVNVGGEWGYQLNFWGEEGIGSSGYITTGETNNLGNFNGPNLQDPASLDGIEFGIISATHGPLNGGLKNQALIDNLVTLTLTMPSAFSESDIGGVNFIYGTAPDETVVADAPPSVPEPSSVALLGTALLGLGALLRRRRS